MNRQGHTGMTLLAFAPVAYVLVSDGKLLLTVLCWVGIQAAEPLPDQDFHFPILTHRGVSHSLLAVLVVGGLLGAGGWLLGERGFDLLYDLLSTSVGIWDWLLGVLPDALAALAGFMPNVPPGEIVATIQHQAGGNVGRWSFAAFGFFIGAYGVFAHLLGDVITERGIKPLLPISHWRLSLSPLRADSPAANSGLFGVGVLAIAVVLVATVPGAILAAGMPADLSPVGVAAGQPANQSGNQTPNQTTNQTTTLSTNATATPRPNQTQNATGASVELDSTNTSAQTVVVRNVHIPQGGFVVIYGEGFSEGSFPDGRGIVVSRYLTPGVHQIERIPMNWTGPANESRLNITRANLTAIVYRDTTNNQHYDSAASRGANDTYYLTQSGKPVADTEMVVIKANVQRAKNLPRAEPAAVRFNDQQSQPNPNQQSQPTYDIPLVTVESVTLPKGGFISIRNPDIPFAASSDIGKSEYLPPGTHQNVTVHISTASLDPGNNTLVAIAHHDTNGDRSLDYSYRGKRDYPYLAQQNGSTAIVKDMALVHVPVTQFPTTMRATPKSTSNPTTLAGPTEPSGTTSEGETTSAETGRGETGSNGGFFSGNPLLLILAGILVVVILLTVVGRMSGGRE